jgi:hypothetical protein
VTISDTIVGRIWCEAGDARRHRIAGAGWADGCRHVRRAGCRDEKLAVWPAYIFEIIDSFRERPNPRPSRFDEDVNDINDPSAIGLFPGEQRAGMRRRASLRRPALERLAELGGS